MRPQEIVDRVLAGVESMILRGERPLTPQQERKLTFQVAIKPRLEKLAELPEGQKALQYLRSLINDLDMVFSWRKPGEVDYLKLTRERSPKEGGPLWHDWGDKAICLSLWSSRTTQEEREINKVLLELLANPITPLSLEPPLLEDFRSFSSLQTRLPKTSLEYFKEYNLTLLKIEF